QLVVFLDRRLVGGKKQAQDLLGGRIYEILLPAEENHDPLVALLGPEVPVGEDLLYPQQQILVVVGLGDEVVGPALQPLDDVLGVVQGGEQDDRDAAQALV